MKSKSIRNGLMVTLVLVIFIFYPKVLDYVLIPKWNLPLGSLITAIGIIAWSKLFHALGSWNKTAQKNEHYLIFINLSRLSIFLAYIWFPLSYWISGNLAFNFINEPETADNWWLFTKAIILLPLIISITERASKLIFNIRKRH